MSGVYLYICIYFNNEFDGVIGLYEVLFVKFRFDICREIMDKWKLLFKFVFEDYMKDLIKFNWVVFMYFGLV